MNLLSFSVALKVVGVVEILNLLTICSHALAQISLLTYVCQNPQEPKCDHSKNQFFHDLNIS